MPDEPSLASTNPGPNEDATVSFTSGAASTRPTQDSEKSLYKNSANPEQAGKRLGYCKPKDGDGLKSYVFAPGVQFEYHFYKPQVVYTELPNVDFWQLRRCVEKIREDHNVSKPDHPIISACDGFLEMYTKPDHLPSEEDFRGLGRYNYVEALQMLLL